VPALIPRGSQIEQEAEGARDLKGRLIIDDSESSDQALRGHRFDVLALCVAHLVEPGAARLDLDVRRQASKRGCRWDDNHDTGATLVKSISRDDNCGPATRLLPTHGIAEVDKPYLAPPSVHLERSRTEALSMSRSAAISPQASGSACSSS